MPDHALHTDATQPRRPRQAQPKAGEREVNGPPDPKSHSPPVQVRPGLCDSVPSGHSPPVQVRPGLRDRVGMADLTCTCGDKCRCPWHKVLAELCQGSTATVHSRHGFGTLCQGALGTDPAGPKSWWTFAREH